MINSHRIGVEALEVVRVIDKQFGDMKEDAIKGVLPDSAKRLMINTVIDLLDHWSPRLNYRSRVQVLEWVEDEYSIYI